MTTPDVPLRFELSVEVPGTPEQVWDAIATAKGISAWMMPTDLDEREGGAVVFHMGPDMSSEGTVTRWDPPRQIVYEEPRWAALAGQDPGTVTPLVSEFLVEARSGGTCVVRVVSSAFGSGADWEQEFFDEMGTGWTPMFEHLRLYLTHFPGQRATILEASTEVPGTPTSAGAAMRAELGVTEKGQTLAVRGTEAEVERVSDDNVLLRLTGPVPGLLALHAYRAGEGTATARVAGYLFSEDAPAYVEREQPGWQTWLERLPADAASTR
jgi:uncharacterized protein YndB with AHSA1/START domain